MAAALIKVVAPAVLAVLAVLYLDRSMALRGLLPPGFSASRDTGDAWSFALRRALAAALLAGLFWIAVFAPLATIGQAPPDLTGVAWPSLFLVHAMLLVVLVLWYFLGFWGLGSGAGSGWSRQFGLAAARPAVEIGLGAAAGVAAWLGVLAVLVILGLLITTLGGADVLPQEPPAIVPWMVGLPVAVRLALSASAGIFEELFFRGFLQPRSGVLFSTVLFVLAHAGYQQPLMLVGVTLLSLIFAFLVRWRQSIWAAVVAHAVFDALQLTVVIPRAIDLLESGVELPVATILDLVL